MSEQSSTAEFDIHRVLRVLRRRKLIIIVLTLVVPSAALAYSLQQTTEYSASATLLLETPNLPQQQGGSLTAGINEDPARIAATDVKLVELGAVARMTEQQLHRPPGNVDVSSDATTDLITITATSSNPEFAAKVANTYAQQYQAFRRQQEAGTILDVRDRFGREYSLIPAGDRNSAQAKSLNTTIGRLSQMAALQTGDAQLVEPATTPSAPSAPRTIRNVIAGLAVGLTLGLALAFLIDMIDRRVREPAELEEIFGRPTLATVPDLRELRSNAAGQSYSFPSRAFEAFQLLRANLRYFNVDREITLVLVTSTLPGEGKTTVAWNLGAAAACGRDRVLLIEADMRRPTLATRLAPQAVRGLSTVLSSQASLESAVVHIPVSRRAGGDQNLVATVDVLFAGPKPPNPTDLLESKRMGRLLEEAKAEYDLIIVDTPPAAVVSDAAPLVRLVDGVIVVSRMRQIKRDAAIHLQKQLERLGAPVIGLVVNALHKNEAYGYGDYYYYGKRGQDYFASTDGFDVEQTEALPTSSNGVGARKALAIDDDTRP